MSIEGAIPAKHSLLCETSSLDSGQARLRASTEDKKHAMRRVMQRGESWCRGYIKEVVIMYKQILIALDGSETSERVLNEAVKMARLTGGKIQAVYVVD